MPLSKESSKCSTRPADSPMAQAERNRKNVYVHLTAKGRALKNKLVPLAVEVNELGLRGVSAVDRATTQRTLLAIIENLKALDARRG